MPKMCDQILEAGGTQRDVEWAAAAELTFALDGAPKDQSRAAIQSVVHQLRSYGEPAEQLFGPPERWAREQQQEWKDQGIAPARGPEEDGSLRSFLVGGLSFTAYIAVLLFVVLLLQGWNREYTTATLVAAPALGFAMQIFRSFYAWSISRYPQRVTYLLCGLTLLILSTVVGTVLVTQDTVLFEGAALWMLAGVAAAGMLAWALSRLMPHGGHAGRFQLNPMADDEWADRFVAALRRRGDLTDQQVQERVSEARSHVDFTGQFLHQEFGEPEAYASRFVEQPRVRNSRQGWFYAGMAALWGYVVFAGIQEEGWNMQLLWQGGLLLMLVGLGIHSWKKTSQS